MNIKSTIYFIAPVIFLCFQWLCGQTGGSRYALFEVKPDARIQGLGGSAVSLEGQIGAVSENPALAPYLPSLSLGTSRMDMFLGEELYALGAGYGNHTWGLSMQWRQWSMGEMDKTDFVRDTSGRILFDDLGFPRDTSLGIFSDISHGFLLSAGFSVLGPLSLGVCGKGLYRSVDDSIQKAWGADAGIYLPLMDSRLSVGALFADVLPLQIENRPDTKSERSVALGLSILTFDDRLLLTGQIENILHREFDRQGGAGLDFRLSRPFSLHAGWNTSYVAFGAGILFDRLRIHYSVIHHSDFGFENPHRITVSYYLGGERI